LGFALTAIVRCTILLTAALQHETPLFTEALLASPRLISTLSLSEPLPMAPRSKAQGTPIMATAETAQPVEAIKATVEKAAAAGNQAFKDGVEKSLAALNDLNAQSKANLEAVVASATAATKGAEALGAQAMAFSKKALEDQTVAAKALASVKSVQEAMELQSSYAKTAMESYMAEVGKFTETFTASFKDSVKPLNERVTAVVEKIQAVR
jgi:phasin family protein